MANLETAKVFVTTYSIYNQGRQFANENTGFWVEVDGIDFEEINTRLDLADPACNGDHEIMFTDFEGFPDCFYSESSINFEALEEYLAWEDHQQEAFVALVENGYSVKEARKAVFFEEVHYICGTIEDYVWENSYDLFGIDNKAHYAGYIDWEMLTRDFEMNESIFETNSGFVWVRH
jgi:antirestriction protein